MVIPMLRAVPATIFMPDSTVKALRSGILFSAMSLTLIPGYGSNLVTVGLRRPFLDLRRFQQLHGCRRGLDNEIEGFIFVNRDDNRNKLALHLLGFGVETLTKLHDIQPFGTKSRAYGRSGVSLASFHLKLYKSFYYLSHFFTFLSNSLVPKRLGSFPDGNKNYGNINYSVIMKN